MNAIAHLAPAGTFEARHLTVGMNLVDDYGVARTVTKIVKCGTPDFRTSFQVTVRTEDGTHMRQYFATETVTAY